MSFQYLMEIISMALQEGAIFETAPTDCSAVYDALALRAYLHFTVWRDFMLNRENTHIAAYNVRC